MLVTASKILLCIALICIFVFAFAPGHWTPAWIVNHDKFSHMMAFLGLGFMMRFSFPKMKLYWLLALLVLFAVSIELLQFGIFNRGFSIKDIQYDLIGIGLFGVFIVIFPLIKKHI